MKLSAKILILLVFALSTCMVLSAQSYDKIPFDAASADVFITTSRQTPNNLIDGDYNTVWESGERIIFYLFPNCYVDFDSKKDVDALYVVRGDNAGVTDVFPILEVEVSESGDDDEWFTVGSFAENEKANKVFPLDGISIDKIKHVRVVPINDFLDSEDPIAVKTITLNEIEARHYHRLNLKLVSEDGVEATHNGVTKDISIMSTEQNVAYKITNIQQNHRFDGWKLGTQNLNKTATSYTHTHTVNKQTDGKTLTMYALASDYVPTFAELTPYKAVSSTKWTNPLTTASNGAKSFTSSDATVATVNSAGEVTCLKEGTTTITLNQAASGNYGPLTASYTLRVSSKLLVVVGGEYAGEYAFEDDAKPKSIANAVDVIAQGDGWTEADLISLKALMLTAQTTLQTVDMQLLVSTGDLGAAYVSMFSGYASLKSVKLPDAGANGSASIAMRYIFQGCTQLLSVTNMEKFTNVRVIASSFRDCRVISEVRLGFDPNGVVEANLANTFLGTNAAAIKYLPLNIDDIPEKWKTSNYKNFALPITIDDIAAPQAIVSGSSLILPSEPNINQSYAARRNMAWEIKKNGGNWEVYTPGDILYREYDGGLLRYKAQRYHPTDLDPDYSYSNSVTIIVEKRDIYPDNDSIVSNSEDFGIITVGEGKTLTINADVTADKIIMKAGFTSYPSLELNAQVKTQELEIHKAIDKNEFYFFSVPFDCQLSDVIAENTHLGQYGVKWLIMEYSESNRAIEGFNSDNIWQYIGAGTIKANQGYVAAHANSTEPVDIIFSKEYGKLSTPIISNQINVKHTEQGYITDRGWNLITVPTLAEGRYKLSLNNADAPADIYVNIPMEHGQNGYTQYRSSEYTFRTSESFFVQVPKTTTVNFTKVDGAQSKAKNSGTQSLDCDYNVYISRTNELPMDKATLLFNESAPRDAYYIMYDLEKLTSFSSSPRVYFLDHNVKLAYSAINPYDYTQVPLGVYIPEDGDYTLSTNFPAYAQYDVVLYDAEKDIEVLTDEYTFTSTVGYTDSRFYLRISQTPTNEDINHSDENPIVYAEEGYIRVEGLKGDETISLYTSNAQLIATYNASNTYLNINNIPSGVYMLNISGTTHKVIVK